MRYAEIVHEKWSKKYKSSINCNNPKGFSQKAHCAGRKKNEQLEEGKRIPRKKGQPAGSKKHSDLYTDENPKGTIHGLKFATVKDAEASVSKIRNSGKKHAHKIQAAVAMEQRAKAAGKKSAAAVYRKYINAMKKKTKAKNESVERTITDQDLQQLETYADRLFASLGIDVEFSKHFKDRVNDPRNAKPITMAELTRLFKQIYKQHGKPIAQLGPDAEAVMKDMRTDVNIPFALQWDGKELDLVAKTVMRKPNFATSNQEFTVEAYMMDLNQDEDMLVLRVKDTDQKHHVEVRGKKNYEIDGYDPKDKLHQVLDKLDPATVAKLYGGEEVFLNPKNSRTAPAIAMAKKLTTEGSLTEHDLQMLEEGIADILKKLPKNLLAKVQPIIKRIPKTAKSLVLITTLLGVMVNAVAAGDMGKVDVQMDKLNSMATMSTTMDAPATGNFSLDDVEYDRNYNGDIAKAMAVKPEATKDAMAMYDKLGGISNDNYEKMSKMVYDKIEDLRKDYQNATAKKGLQGADALQSDEYKEFRKQSNDLKIMLSTAMEIMTKDAGATGKAWM